MFIAPLTLNRCSGAVVPMPTLVSALAPLILPSTSELLAVTWALAPTAVAFVTPAMPFEFAPMNVLLSSAVFESPALSPKKELLEPVVLLLPARPPKKELSDPVVLRLPAFLPKKELMDPLLLSKPAPVPKKAFAPPLLRTPARSPKMQLSFPVVLKRPAKAPKKELRIPVVLDSPAWLPKKEFSFAGKLTLVVFALPALKPTKVLSVPVLTAPVPTPAKTLF